MTKEQEEAIERLNRFKTIKVLYSNTFAMHIEQLKTVQEDIETVLNIIKLKDKQIDFYKKGLEREIESNTDNIIEIIDKDNQIDLMADYMLSGLEDTAFNNICKQGHCVHELKDNRPTKCRKCENCIKEYFENKVKE